MLFSECTPVESTPLVFVENDVKNNQKYDEERVPLNKLKAMVSSKFLLRI